MKRLLLLFFALCLSVSGVWADGYPTSTTGLMKSANIDPSAGITGSQIANNTITTSQVDASFLQMVGPINLSVSDIQNLYGTGKTLVADPPANQVVVFDHVLIDTTYGAAYTGGGNVYVQYNGGKGSSGNAPSPGITAALFTNSNAQTATAGAQMSNQNISFVHGKGLILTNITGAFAGGAGTTAEVYVWYRVITP